MDIVLGADIIRYPLTGIGRYAYELGKGLSELPEVRRLSFLVGMQVRSAMPQTERRDGKLRDSIFRSAGKIAGQSSTLMTCYQGCKEYCQTRSLKRFRGSVFHGPNFYLPNHDGPCVSTFHDLSIINYPEFHPSVRVAYMSKALPRALNRAQILLTVSEHARKELIAYSGFSPERIIATALAAGPEFHPRNISQCESVLKDYNLNYKGYCLFTGTVEPRKNLGRLLSAYERLPLNLRKELPLVVVGYRGWESDVLFDRLMAAQSAGWVKYLGFVSSEILPLIFSAAKIFLFPSIYEGFGLPVLEAMASGVPVICSNSTSIPEVAGDAALMVDPFDEEKLYFSISEAIENTDFADRACVAGLQRASTFSWEKVVKNTFNAYKLAESLA